MCIYYHFKKMTLALVYKYIYYIYINNGREAYTQTTKRERHERSKRKKATTMGKHRCSDSLWDLFVVSCSLSLYFFLFLRKCLPFLCSSFLALLLMLFFMLSDLFSQKFRFSVFEMEPEVKEKEGRRFEAKTKTIQK